MSILRCVSTRAQAKSLTFDPGFSLYNNVKHLLRIYWANFKQIVEPSEAEGTGLLFK